ncbi:MAG: MGMT family protein [Candidatus Verstraetearchaeota archaeon]|jgi:methylated-DNA-[protein]-cysteine S-methyltransferase|nr:MGMT family protein [Candidatus Verstraetearchaeota archaeon]
MTILVYDVNKGRIRRAKLEDYVEIVKALMQLIPEGRVSTYGSIAKALKINPKLVGKIVKMNDEPVIYPCHRIVKSDGSFGGYSGLGGTIFKKRLLEFEGVKVSKNGKILSEHISDIMDLLC